MSNVLHQHTPTFCWQKRLMLSDHTHVHVPRRARSTRRAVRSAATAAPEQSSPRPIVIGGGIVGASVAYFLAERGAAPIVLERTAVAAAAGGKGGGFLARGWGNSQTRALHEISFDLHSELAQRLGIESYRKIKTLSVQGDAARRGRQPFDGTFTAEWLDGDDITSVGLLDDETAQIDPREYTTKVMSAAESMGAEVRLRDRSTQPCRKERVSLSHESPGVHRCTDGRPRLWRASRDAHQRRDGSRWREHS
mmetsp:Transcript_4353/g.15063  ORF Transcript_4353/g.15063 Transcript_4353/m.15063 type:complete len:251 (-) Transcript_4353:2026-2778(-)